ncbi:MAG: WbuC family cupin fold metalloprotein, partial [Bacteroidota bacterium]
MTPPTLAMQASDNDLTIIHTAQMEQLILAARQSPRKRMILPFHKSDDALLHRMFNAIQPGSYIPPHRHFRSQKAESIILLRGAIAYFTFSEKGEVTGIYHLKAGSPQFGMDTEPTIFHTFIAL